MSRSLKMSFIRKIILSSSVPSKREGLEVVQLCAVIIDTLHLANTQDYD